MSVVQCVACGCVGTPKVKGSFVITLILLFIGFLPGIIYEIWRRSGGKVCRGCGSYNIRLFTTTPEPQQAPIKKVIAQPAVKPPQTTLVADSLFSYNQSIETESKANQLTAEELAKQELRRRNQAFIASKSKKGDFNFIKLSLVIFGLVLGIVLVLAVNN